MSAPTTELVPADLDERAAAVERAVAEARSRAEALEVTNPEQEQRAARILQEVKRQEKAAKADHKDLKAPILEAGRRVDAKFKDAVAPLKEIEAVVKAKIGAYRAEIERREREERERLERERAERERIAREARERQEAEERARRQQAEREAREAAEEAAKAKAEADREAAEQLAEEARQKAEEAKIAESAIASLPEPSLPTPAVESAPKAQGISTRRRWQIKAIDPSCLPRAWMLPDEKRINAAMRESVKATGSPPEIPGVEFEQVSDVAVRG